MHVSMVTKNFMQNLEGGILKEQNKFYRYFSTIFMIIIS